MKDYDKDIPDVKYQEFSGDKREQRESKRFWKRHYRRRQRRRNERRLRREHEFH